MNRSWRELHDKCENICTRRADYQKWRGIKGIALCFGEFSLLEELTEEGEQVENGNDEWIVLKNRKKIIYK